MDDNEILKGKNAATKPDGQARQQFFPEEAITAEEDLLADVKPKNQAPTTPEEPAEPPEIHSAQEIFPREELEPEEQEPSPETAGEPPVPAPKKEKKKKRSRRAPSAQKQARGKASAKSIALVAGISVLLVTVVVLLVFVGIRGAKSPSTERKEATVVVNAVSDQTPINGQRSNVGGHGGFPLSFGGGILSVKGIPGGMYVLTGDALCYVSTSGAYRTPLNHKYIDPVLETGGSYGLIFDRLSSGFQLCSERKCILEGTSENKQPLSTAAVSEKGDVLLAAKGANYASLLTYYNRKGEILFSWECAKEYIVAVDIADNRQDLLCAAVGVRSNSALYTKLYKLNIYEDQTVWENVIAAGAATECHFVGNDVLVVFGDRRVLVRPGKKEDAKKPAVYDSAALLCNTDDKGNTAIVRRKLGTLNDFELTVYDKDNEEVFTRDLDNRPLAVACRGKTALVLTDQGILKVRRRGKLREVCRFEETERGLLLVGSDVFHFNKKTLYKN